MQATDYTRWFRGSTPYISAHRSKTFVVLLGGDAYEHVNLTNIIHDLALLHVLGVRLVLVHGARPQIEDTLNKQIYHHERRVTDAQSMEQITGVYGQMRARLEALFSTGLPNTPLHNVEIPVITGNFITARPIGIVDGVDHLFTGEVRRVEEARIQATLSAGALLLQSPLGYSPSGQVFNLTAEALATDIAIQIKADKLIVFDQLAWLSDSNGERMGTFTPTELERRIDQFAPTQQTRLASLVRAVRGGVTKSHLISYEQDGALLAELFTAEGIGTQVLEQPSRAVRPARLEDVSGIAEVIRPLEESGVLVRRERDRLEQEVERFLVAELDGIVVGCCAIYPYAQQAELACVAVHENYRSKSGNGIGAGLLEAAQHAAKAQGCTQLFVLTTQTRDWFLEQGFIDADLEVLPAERQSLYNWQRGSRVMTKSLA